LLADESRLELLFVNLLVNAVQAIPEGRAEEHQIRIVTRTEGRELVAEVDDTGSGIPTHVLPRIFEPYFTTKPVGAGTGLGLSVCQTIVTEHGGKLEAESDVGRGSLFRVRLPCLEGVVAAFDAVAAGAAPSRGLAPARVLVVDDEELVGRTIKRMLGKHHEVLVVNRGSDALGHLAAGERFDAIVSDLMMPNMTGIQLVAEIARLHPDMLDRIIIMTGGAFSPEAHEFLKGLRTKPLMKPFVAEELMDAIDRVRAKAPTAPPV
jgi:CheY-like chemotaxis protein/anti-sigma regulatory factor (Ser/Thr protein kinase)